MARDRRFVCGPPALVFDIELPTTPIPPEFQGFAYVLEVRPRSG